MSRPLVSVYGLDGLTSVSQVKLPGVFESPIRTDVVHHVYRDIAKNRRQAYGVSKKAGHQTSAESWGTGRAVARIPRVPGGGTHRAGQGAFGNMCRGGRMFAPTKTYRRWHRKVNKNQRRFALVSALSASANAPLVMARGHRIASVPEIPLVIANEAISDICKTTSAKKFFKAIHAIEDVDRVKDSKRMRAGIGKLRNRRFRQRRGPLIVYNERAPMNKAFRNLPGVEFCSVNALNLLKLAPGGHMGRFIIWTRDAFERLNALYGSYKVASAEKFGYKLPRPVMSNSDLSRLINSSEIQSVLRPKVSKKKFMPIKKNPLKNLGVMLKLNPYAKTQRRRELLRSSMKAKKIAKHFFASKSAAKADNIRRFAEKAEAKKAGKEVAKFVATKVKIPHNKSRTPRIPGRKPAKHEKKNKDAKMNPHKKAFVRTLLK